MNKKDENKPVAGSLLENEGEGSKSAARRYAQSTQEFIESGKVDEAAHNASEALEGPEGDELRRAEQESKNRAVGGVTKK
ncbi:hypothetical protein [Polyangium aurulentum]|uniref:hypothetical protein n=1 Tax=Polyangium aurulentum TaxID=2567896 RepID=UPI0010AE9A6D|nr:hypothetical protein [Polyangium aurulentum]UQA57849.1 hypothetical protein E8A73_042325 [Polyangium aurulentum]